MNQKRSNRYLCLSSPVQQQWLQIIPPNTQKYLDRNDIISCLGAKLSIKLKIMVEVAIQTVVDSFTEKLERRQRRWGSWTTRWTRGRKTCGSTSVATTYGSSGLKRTPTWSSRGCAETSLVLTLPLLPSAPHRLGQTWTWWKKETEGNHLMLQQLPVEAAGVCCQDEIEGFKHDGLGRPYGKASGGVEGGHL